MATREFANGDGITVVRAKNGGNYSKGRNGYSIDTITPHCTAGLMSDDCIKTFYSTKDYCPNYSIGETGKIFGHVSEANRSWCTCSSYNDNRAITIECDSEASEEYFMPAAVINSLKKLCINICNYYGKTRLVCDYNLGNTAHYNGSVKELTYPSNDDGKTMYLTFHRWFTAKSCPGDYFYSKAKAFAEEVTVALGGTIQATKMSDLIKPNADVATKKAVIAKVGGLFTADQSSSGILASISLAQFILESGYGTSVLAQNANNLFGMKSSLSGNNWGSSWKGATYNYNGATWRKYDCIEDSIKDHSAYLANAKSGSSLRYKGLVGCTDYIKAASIIVSGGYAGANNLKYAKNLTALVSQYNLGQYNYTGKSASTAATAISSGKTVTVVKNTIDTDRINELIDEVQTAGKDGLSDDRKNEIVEEIMNLMSLDKTAAQVFVERFITKVEKTKKVASEPAETWVTNLFASFSPVEESSQLLLDQTSRSSNGKTNNASNVIKIFSTLTEISSQVINKVKEIATMVAMRFDDEKLDLNENAAAFVEKVLSEYLKSNTGEVVLEGYYKPFVETALQSLSKGKTVYDIQDKTYYVIQPLRANLLENLSEDYVETLTNNDIVTSVLQKGLMSAFSKEQQILLGQGTDYISATQAISNSSYPSAKAFSLLARDFTVKDSDGNDQIVSIDELYSYGDYIGYKYTPLTYSGEDFIGKPGESVVTILDKVKNKFSLYEYFYDVNGIFHFQKKKTYIESAYGANEKDQDEQEYICTFNDKNDIISVSHSTNLDNVKNDYSIWGTTTGEKPVKFHVRVGLNKRPTSYVTYNGNVYVGIDYREIIFQMAKDYASNHEKNDFLAKLEANNPWAKGGKTGFESFYTDVREFWPQLYWGETTGNKIKTLADFTNYYTNFYHTGEYADWATAVAGRVDLIFWFEIIESDPQYWISNIGDRMKSEDSSEITAVDYREIPNIVWLPAETSNSSLYSKYAAALEKYVKDYTANQSGGITDDAVAEDLAEVNTWANAAMELRGDLRKYLQKYLNGAPLFLKEDGTVVAEDDYLTMPTRKDTLGNSYIPEYISPELLEQDFTSCKKGTSAIDKVEEYLYSYTNFGETKTITIVPNYDLEVNRKILYLGEPYIIQKITVPLTYNGTMSLTLSKVYEI